jgi:hypothetical protein
LSSFIIGFFIFYFNFLRLLMHPLWSALRMQEAVRKRDSVISARTNRFMLLRTMLKNGYRAFNSPALMNKRLAIEVEKGKYYEPGAPDQE